MFWEGTFDDFRRKLSTYDKANWEIIAERQKESRNRSANSWTFKDEHPKRDLIDVDLVRGSNFYKAKPSYKFVDVSIRATFRILLYPFYCYWWMSNIPTMIYLYYLGVYLCSIFSIAAYAYTEERDKSSDFTQLFCSLSMLFVFGQIFVHVVSTNLTRPRIPPSKACSVRNLRRCNSFSAIPKIEFRKSKDNVLIKRSGRFTTKTQKRESNRLNDDHELSDKYLVTETLPVKSEDYLKIPDAFKEREELSDFEDEKRPEVNDQNSRSSDSSSSISEEEVKRYNPHSGDAKVNRKIPCGINIENQVSNEEHATYHVKAPLNQRLTVTLFDESGEPIRRAMSILDISSYLDRRVLNRQTEDGYTVLCACLIVCMTVLPLFYHAILMVIRESAGRVNSYSEMLWISIRSLISLRGFQAAFIFSITLVRFSATVGLCILLTVAGRTYSMKYAYAKYFSSLTSFRRAKRNRLPHFRLDKVKNIKAWLSLRSYLKKSGPVRSVELIVAATFFMSVLLIVIVCYKFLEIVGSSRVQEAYLEELHDFLNWEVIVIGTFLSIFLLKFMTLLSDIRKKFHSHSELITEEINLYLKMERNPEKKDSLLIANCVLKLAAKLLKELEPPNRVSVLLVSPLMLNIMRVIFFSFLSAVVSEIFGIRFKLWKIKAT